MIMQVILYLHSKTNLEGVVNVMDYEDVIMNVIISNIAYIAPKEVAEQKYVQLLTRTLIMIVSYTQVNFKKMIGEIRANIGRGK